MNDIEMAAESLFQSLVCWSPVLMILAGATVIVAVATARRTPKPGTEPSAPAGVARRAARRCSSSPSGWRCITSSPRRP